MPDPDDTPRLTVEDTERYRRHVDAAAHALAERIDAETARPTTALVLGARLRRVADALDPQVRIPYADVPHFPANDEPLDGAFLIGTMGETAVVAMDGRLTLADGYTPREVVFPIRVLATLGVDTMGVTAAASGLDPHHTPGDVMLATDHVNFQGANPLVGPNVGDWGVRFPDMSEPYDLDLREAAVDAALDCGHRLHQGVYVAVRGPNHETAAELRMLRAMGADAVGTSLVPEVIAARHMDVRVLGLVALTDTPRPDALAPVPDADVRAAAASAVETLTAILEGVLADA